MATLAASRQYTLSDFKNKEDSGNIPELENLVIEKINKLASRVGAPTYQKTPVFKRYNYNKKKKVNENISSDDWETIRNFKTTTLDKNMEGLEAQMDKIRSYLIGKGINDRFITDTVNNIRDQNSDQDFFSAIKICKKKRIGPARTEDNRSLFYKKDISLLARNGFDFETSKKVMDIKKDDFLKIIKLL